MTLKQVEVITSIAGVLITVVGIEIIRYRKGNAAPLGESRPIQYASGGVLQSARQQFLDGEFTIVKDMRSLPLPVLEVFTEQGGSRLVIANPGENFEATDLIRDSNVPRRRLVFAGLLNDRCFIHYERGGRGHSY